MTILSLDTSSAAGSSAIIRAGAIVIERAGDGTRTHGERLPKELMIVLDEAGLSIDQVDGFAVAVGPGSFTGLRVGIATIQGLALAGGKRVTPISTFEALAASARTRETPSAVGIWIDAHRGEVFATLFAPDGAVLEAPTARAPEATLDAWHTSLAGSGPMVWTGDGAVKYRDAIEQRLGARARIEPAVPSLAGIIGTIAASAPQRAVLPHALVPLYVRRSDAELARDRRRGA